MRKLIAILITIAISTALVRAQPPADLAGDDDVRFVAFDVYIDSGDESLAAYQIDISDLSGRTKIVGVEGGESTAFDAPPYYDPAALHNEGRIILGAFTIDDDATTGKSRVARLHMQINGEQDADFDVKLIVAADIDGRDIDTNVTITEGNR